MYLDAHRYKMGSHTENALYCVFNSVFLRNIPQKYSLRFIGTPSKEALSLYVGIVKK